MSDLRRIKRDELETILQAAERRSEAMKSGVVLLEFHCLTCGGLIPEGRSQHGAVTCCHECAKTRSKRLRDWRASRSCRLCGRRARKVRTVAESTGVVAIESGVCAEAAQVNA
jgi:hypothetical protein